MVKHLLEGHDDDMHVLQALSDFLHTRDEDHADIRGLDKCTGEPHQHSVTRQWIADLECTTHMRASASAAAKLASLA